MEGSGCSSQTQQRPLHGSPSPQPSHGRTFCTLGATAMITTATCRTSRWTVNVWALWSASRDAPTTRKFDNGYYFLWWCTNGGTDIYREMNEIRSNLNRPLTPSLSSSTSFIYPHRYFALQNNGNGGGHCRCGYAFATDTVRVIDSLLLCCYVRCTHTRTHVHTLTRTPPLTFHVSTNTHVVVYPPMITLFRSSPHRPMSNWTTHSALNVTMTSQRY